MADDPRVEPLAKDLFERSGFPFPWAAAQQGFWRDTATAQPVSLDAVDRLRALLADEDRALDLIANAIYGVDGNPGPAPLRYAFPVLAALREVAGL